MDKYKRLVSNTILTAINQFSSKVLTLLMAAYYMRRMAPEEYGAITAVQTVDVYKRQLQRRAPAAAERRHRKPDGFGRRYHHRFRRACLDDRRDNVPGG